MNINKKFDNGFTMVELLIVIVIIGVLTAITVVSYTSLSERAVASSLVSDLNNSSRLLKMYSVLYGTYPTSLDANYCPIAPTEDLNYCLKASVGNSYNHYQVDNSTSTQSFALEATNSSDTSYRITGDSKPLIVNNSRTSCLDIQNASESTGSGVYWITPKGGSEIQVFCDMVSDGGGWTKIYEGLVTSSTSVSRTFGNVVEISNNIAFNNMKIQSKNWNNQRIGTTTETAVLLYPISWYFEWLHDEPDTPNPNVKFHDINGNQDVQFTTLGQILYGYGNSWRNLISGQYNTQDADSSMYLGGVNSSIHTDDWGYGDYNTHMNDDFPKEGGLGLTPRQFQEINIWVK